MTPDAELPADAPETHVLYVLTNGTTTEWAMMTTATEDDNPQLRRISGLTPEMAAEIYTAGGDAVAAMMEAGDFRPLNHMIIDVHGLTVVKNGLTTLNVPTV